MDLGDCEVEKGLELLVGVEAEADAGPLIYSGLLLEGKYEGLLFECRYIRYKGLYRTPCAALAPLCMP